MNFARSAISGRDEPDTINSSGKTVEVDIEAVDSNDGEQHAHADLHVGCAKRFIVIAPWNNHAGHARGIEEPPGK